MSRSPIRDAFDRAIQDRGSRPLPQSLGAQMTFLMKQHKGSTASLAKTLGVSQRTVQRWNKGVQSPKDATTKEKIMNAVKKRWQPNVRKRALTKIENSGLVVSIRATMGYTGPPGSSSDPRKRQITQYLSPGQAGPLLAAYASGAPEHALNQALGAALGEAYFRDNNSRAAGLDCQVEDTDYVDMGI